MRKTGIVLLGLSLIAAGCGSSSGGTTSAQSAASSSLTLVPNVSSVSPGGTVQFTASGGVPPYTYSVISPASPSGGTINPSSGLYIAPGANETVQVEVTDSKGAVATTAITIGAAAGGGTVICNSVSNCESVVGASAELDGGYYGGLNAVEACLIQGYRQMTTFQTQNHPINCGNMYTLAEWSGRSFQNYNVQICYQGYVTVLSEISCSN